MSMTINDPSTIFRLFATNCMSLEPAISISREQEAIVAAIIDDISNGRAVAALKAGEQFLIVPLDSTSVPEAVKCSTYLAFFLEFLCEQMLEQKARRVSSLRATELLYNFDGRGASPDQPLMRLEGAQLSFSIKSTKVLEKQIGCKLQLFLSPQDADDWTINPVE